MKKTFFGRFISKTRDLLDTIETAPLSFSGFMAAFLSIILIRLLVESAVNGFGPRSLSFMFLEFSHTFLFFLFAFILFLWVARIAGATSLSRAVNLLLFGFVIIWTPPVLDTIIFQGGYFWSFYELDGLSGLASRFFHFFGDTPDIGITYGVRIEVALMTIGLALYAFLRSKNLFHSLRVALLTYIVFFVLGTFPSWVAIPVIGIEKGIFSVTELDVAGFTLSPEKIFETSAHDPRMALSIKMSLVYAILVVAATAVLLFQTAKKIFLALLNNARFPQAIWHGGLFFLGGGLAVLFAGAEPDFGFFEVLSLIVMIIAIESAWLASVVGNDLADQNIDHVTNTSRPIPSGTIPAPLYTGIGIAFFAVSILFSAIVSFKAALLLLAYQAIAWIYSLPPLRLKRVPGVATALAAAAGLVVLFSGFSVFAPSAEAGLIPASILVLLFGAYAATLPLKDFKDIDGDRKDGVFTLPVILGEERARIAIGTALFLCYAISPIVLHDIFLTIPALLFGGLAFTSVIRAERPTKTWGSFRSLPAWNILFASLYGAIVALILL